MKMFAKWIPTEGDANSLKKDEFYFSYIDGIRYKKSRDTQPLTPEDTIAKFCLCTRDIQVGDWVTFDNGQEMFADADILNALKKDGFKVLGVISPAAKWVKEDDEFDDDEVNITKLCRDSESNWQYACLHCGAKRGCDNDEGNICHIKGQCEHFH